MADQPTTEPQSNPPHFPGNAAETANNVPIVGIGASAGGLEAFLDFLSNIPADTGMAFVFVQHLDPHQQSLLPEILQERTAMQVRRAENGMRPEPNCVYVIPPNSLLEIGNRTLRLTARPDAPNVPMPIDAFFRSLARDAGAGAIAVVLSGTASDGTLGLQAIKAEGGITFAQDPATAAFDGMPRSAIAAGNVDCVMAPRDIALELARIGQHPYAGDPDMGGAGADAERDFADIFSSLRNAVKVDFSLYKHATIRRRIYRRMALHKIKSTAEYAKLLRERREEAEALFDDLLINVTAFFREPATFEALRAKVYPLLLKRRAAEDPVRVWIPGCATGEEAYSVGISLVEFMEEAGFTANLQIFGTDLSERALERARAGIYPENISADVSPERLRKFFTKANGEYQVSRTIRDYCIFARQNVAKDPPFSHLDLLVCRNLLIYLGPLLQKKVMKVFHYALKPAGYLVLGASESLGGSDELFAPIGRGLKIYSPREAPGFRTMNFDAHDAGAKRETPPPVLETPIQLRKRMDAVLLARYTPAAVLVNRDLRLIQFHGPTARFLQHPGGAANLDIQRMARDGLGAEILHLLQEIENRKAPLASKLVTVALEEGVAQVRVSMSPMDGLPEDPMYLVVFEEVHVPAPAEEGPRAGKAGKKKPGSAEKRIGELEEELSLTRRYLQTVIEDQEAITEELKSANEEIQSSNEELQSTNEELLTAKEELQSTNEELTTVNEEMQNRNDELIRVNNDLVNLLASVNIPIVMLSGDLKIRRFTPMTERLLNLLPGDVGRPIRDFKLKINVPDLEEQVHGVVDRLTPIEREVHDNEGRVFSMWIRPYRTFDNKIDGAVLSLFDITDRKEASAARYRRLFESSRDGLIAADGVTGAILDVNPSAARLIGKARGELIGVPFYAVEVLARAGMRAQTLGEMGENGNLRRDVSIERGDGQWTDLEILASAYEEGGERLAQFNLRDVTVRRRAGARRGADDAGGALRDLEAAERVAARVSRDLGNDLTTVLLLCDLLLEKNAGAAFAADVREIRDAARGAAGLNRQLLAFGRRDTGRTERIDVNQVLSGLRQVIATAAGGQSTVNSRLDPGLRPVEATRAQIERIIVNLLIDRRQGGNARGNLSVQTANMRIDPEFSGKHPAVKPGEYVSITVTESAAGATKGAGPERSSRLDPLQYSGLPAAFEAIRQIGGHVWAFSEPGAGSTIQVLLPPAPEAPPEPGPESGAEETGDAGTILLIDPHTAARAAAARALEKAGHSVLQAGSVEEARGRAEGAGGPIGLVLADVDGENGSAEAAEALAQACKAAIAYICSGPDAALAAAGVPDADEETLRKPYSAGELVTFVRHALKRK